MSPYAEFRAVPTKVAELRKALELPILREAFEVMRSPDRALYNEVLSDISPTFASVRLGTILGDNNYERDLKRLATHPKPNEQVGNTYEPAEE